MKKALSVGKQFAQHINQERIDDACTSCSSSSSDEEREEHSPSIGLKNLCSNGQCAWKVKDKYDDIIAEIFETDKRKRKSI